jgi:alkylation response protein AidB-like acyl-CoA dehydrogenase
MSSRTLFEEEHEAYRESVRSFLDRTVVPEYASWQKAGTVPREVFAIAGEHGFAALQVPEEHGGAGIDDFRFNVVLAEETMRAGVAGFALMLTTHNDVCVPALIAAGHPALEAVAAGELLGAWVGPGLVTAEGGRLRAKARGIVNGGVAGVVLVATGEGVAVVDAGAVGRAPAEPIVGMRACDRADLIFDDVPHGDLLPLQDLQEHLSVAVLSMAGAHAAFAWTLDYVHERRAFGIPIAEFQNTRYALADVVAEIEVTQAYLDACVLERNRGDLSARRAAVAKLRATETLARAVDWGVQLHGGYGYMLEYPIAHAFADARFLRLHGGTSEAMRDTIAAAAGV